MRANLLYRTGRILLYTGFKFFFGLKVYGKSNVPEEGPVIIAPNHRSNYDPPLVGCCIDTRPVYFLAKKGLFINKFSSWFLRRVNTFPVDKKVVLRALRKITGLLREGWAVMIFPEGTRSKTDDFLPPEPGVGFISMRNNIPVIPTYIKGTTESMVAHFFHKSSLEVHFGKPVYPENYDFNDYYRFTEEIMNRIKAMKYENNSS